MCSLCGMLGGKGHWTETSSTPEAFQSRLEPTTRGRERQERTRLVNAVLGHYGLSLSDWSGASYMLSGRTGQTALVENLTEMWAAAERVGKKPCDPLDEGLIAGLLQHRRS